MLNSDFWLKVARAIWFLFVSFLVVFGVLRLGIDFITFWDTPRFVDWEPRQRGAFLGIWIVLGSALAIILKLADD